MYRMLKNFEFAMLVAVAVFAWSLAWSIWFPVKQTENIPRQRIAAQQTTKDPQCYMGGALATGDRIKFDTLTCVHRNGLAKELPIK